MSLSQSKEIGDPNRNRRAMTCRMILWGLLACVFGCEQAEKKLPTEYGRVSGSDGSTSLNGVSVFYDMFRSRGFNVKRRKRLTPIIDRYETLVWFPNNQNCPSESVIDFLTDWLKGGRDRTLIYVGRDYECQLDYLQRVAGTVPPDQKEELLRQIAEAMARQDAGPMADDYGFYLREANLSCEWFKTKEHPRQEAEKITGSLTSGLETENMEFEYGTLLSTSPRVQRKYDYRYDALIKVDRRDFAFEIFNPEFNAKVIVVSNGTFLLNYALVNEQHRMLANRLIDKVDQNGDVIFLESGPRGIPVSDSINGNHSQWAWIAEPPLRYIVPHLLIWGAVFCFVCYPIFGRPRRVKHKNESTFRNHISATGKLLERSGQIELAKSQIEEYQEKFGSDRKRKTESDS